MFVLCLQVKDLHKSGRIVVLIHALDVHSASQEQRIELL
jgi:hypothetical protein